jgi:hypothetical protein
MISKSPFPLNRENGFSTGSEIKCNWCGTIYNKGMDADKGNEGESVMYIDFGNLWIAQCCFDDFEQTILTWSLEIIELIETAAEVHQKAARSKKELARRGAKALKNLEI